MRLLYGDGLDVNIDGSWLDVMRMGEATQRD
jgi:hypothetical protein